MPRLRISCLGDFDITLAEKNITANFDTDKTRALLIYLMLEAAHAHPRLRLAGLLWPDHSDERALQNLRQRLPQLRKILEGETGAVPFLLITRDTVQWNQASDFWLDAAAFEQTLDQAYRHSQRLDGQGMLAIRPLKKAVSLFGGQFLERFSLDDSDLFEEWAALQREKYNRLAVEALALMADYHEQRGENMPARQMAAHLAALENPALEDEPRAKITRWMAEL